ncbi:MAG: hypothetical protein ING02_05900 [Roseomonas sp.]|nr:hypothetical protein [Roseomonas sp.]
MGISVAVFPHTVFAARYAPVHQLRILSMRGNRLSGLAAPESGPLPSAVILAAGERILGVSIATAFSEEAKVSGLRDGWCGFELSALQQALAYGPHGEIRCAATNRALITLDDDAIGRAVISVPAALNFKFIQDENLHMVGSGDLQSLWPYARRFLDWKGPTAFIEACHNFFLGRPSDPHGRSRFESALAAGEEPRSVWLSLLGSDECKSRGLKVFPGPSHPDFPFRSISTVEFIRGEIQRTRETEDLDLVWPYAERLLKEKGVTAFIEACYSYLLGRPSDPPGRSRFENALAAGEEPRAIWLALLGSDECKSKGLKFFPGPFHPDFPFSLKPFGSRPPQSAAAPGAGRKPSISA